VPLFKNYEFKDGNMNIQQVYDLSKLGTVKYSGHIPMKLTLGVTKAWDSVTEILSPLSDNSISIAIDVSFVSL
jgi:hypothetical protein